MSGEKEAAATVFTIGHSTRTLGEFTELLQTYAVTIVIDVRTVPRSRHNPQFNKETLPNALKPVRYIHMPEIGGLRHPKRDSINLALQNSGFRGYADYMQTQEFTDGLLKLVALARENCVAVMCAEALPWRCHRSLLSDALVARHVAGATYHKQNRHHNSPTKRVSTRGRLHCDLSAVYQGVASENTGRFWFNLVLKFYMCNCMFGCWDRVES